MQKLKLAYFGTPDFSAEFLQKLVTDPDLPAEVQYVFTQPDSPVGRKQIVTKTPVRETAEKHKIDVLTDLKSAAALLKEMDLAVLFAYGVFIPRSVLTAPRFGFWNIHPSLLPKYRGPAPIATPLLHGDIETGVTLIKMDDEMDHGPVIGQEKVYIFPLWRRDQLTDHLVEQGFELFKKVLITYIPDLSKAPIIEQDHDEATYTKKLEKDDGFVAMTDLRSTTYEVRRKIFNKFRAYYPWPGIWTKVRIKNRELRMKITKIHWENDDLVIKKVQLEGKTEVDYEQFKKAYNVSFS